jgi:hypothetical protein
VRWSLFDIPYIAEPQGFPPQFRLRAGWRNTASGRWQETCILEPQQQLTMGERNHFRQPHERRIHRPGGGIGLRKRSGEPAGTLNCAETSLKRFKIRSLRFS